MLPRNSVDSSLPPMPLERPRVNFDFATTGYATPWGDQRGELPLSSSETPSLRSPGQDRRE